MARQAKARSIEAATGATVGERVDLKGHPQVGMLVVARNFSTTDDTLNIRLDMEHEADVDADAVPAPIVSMNPVDVLEVNGDDLEDIEGDGTATVFGVAHNIPAEHVRARITDFADGNASGLEVDVWVYAGGWNGPAREFREMV